MSMWIRIDDGVATLALTPPADRAVFRTALIEARGAMLSWDVASGQRFPDAEIHSPLEASAWLAEIYGEEIAAAVRAAAATSLPVPGSAELVDAAHRLAWLMWASDWWPAGVYTPALNGPILAAETAVAAHAVEHLLDDEDAVERTLHQAVDAPSALAAVPLRLRADAAALLDVLTGLADDHGIALSAATVSTSSADWALAAGARGQIREGIEIGHGLAPVRWADVPAQTVAADSDARWSLRHIDGVPHLHVSVAAVPVAAVPSTEAPGTEAPGAEAELWARFGPESLDLDIPLQGDSVGFTGNMQVAASIALLPLEERTLWIRDPLLAAVPGPAESEDDRDAVRAQASIRLDDPDASLAERAAAE
ncbi:MAG: hypothetical protein ACTH07_07430 [Microbacterium sp.]